MARTGDFFGHHFAACPDSGGPVIYKGKLAGIYCSSAKGTNTTSFIACESVRVLILEYAGEK
jgi:hypothetical protein